MRDYANTVAERFDTFDLYSVSMYEWIFPSAVVGKPPAAVKFGAGTAAPMP